MEDGYARPTLPRPERGRLSLALSSSGKYSEAGRHFALAVRYTEDEDAELIAAAGILGATAHREVGQQAEEISLLQTAVQRAPSCPELSLAAAKATHAEGYTFRALLTAPELAIYGLAIGAPGVEQISTVLVQTPDSVIGNALEAQKRIRDVQMLHGTPEPMLPSTDVPSAMTAVGNWLKNLDRYRGLLTAHPVSLPTVTVSEMSLESARLQAQAGRRANRGSSILWWVAIISLIGCLSSCGVFVASDKIDPSKAFQGLVSAAAFVILLLVAIWMRGCGNIRECQCA